jgi:hypothetical protein
VVPKAPDIDISENRLRNRGRVLDILLSVRGTIQSIIWATDSYTKLGTGYQPKNPIKHQQITGTGGKLIQPRAAKSRAEQIARTKDKAEVFTPLKVVKEMNLAIDWSSKSYPATKDTWVDYISEKRLEITCGEAPFIAGRYNPTANTDTVIKPHNRVGFLDRKLQVVKEFTNTKEDWLQYAERALKSSYGYEWQGDNLLIARENVLLTMDDFYQDFCADKLKLKTKQQLSDEQLEHFATIISWNIWQMDGLKYVRPMSCKQTVQKTPDIPKNQLPLLPLEKPKKKLVECEGCRLGDPLLHTGNYAKIKDWATGKTYRFVDLLDEDLDT